MNVLDGVGNFRYSRLLFTKNNAPEGIVTPVVFYSSVDYNHLEDLITRGGGILGGKTEDTINLCSDSDKQLLKEGYVPLSYIRQCILKNTLIDPDNYRRKVFGIPSVEMPSADDDDDDDDDDDSFNDTRSVCKSPAYGVTKGRNSYTDYEDHQILEYIHHHNGYKRIRSRDFWTEMERKKVTSHTSQSMRSRFLKTVLPKIHLYDIPKDWKQRLAGKHPRPWEISQHASSTTTTTTSTTASTSTTEDESEESTFVTVEEDHGSTISDTSLSMPANTNSSMPANTNSSMPANTNSSMPANTNSSMPANTSSSMPANTNSSMPANTNSSMPANTNSSMPANTNSSMPANTNSSMPANTNSSMPANTNSSMPANTNSSMPANTNSSMPANTNSSMPANTNSSMPANTNSSMPANTNSSMPANTNSKLQSKKLNVFVKEFNPKDSLEIQNVEGTSKATQGKWEFDTRINIKIFNPKDNLEIQDVQNTWKVTPGKGKSDTRIEMPSTSKGLRPEDNNEGEDCVSKELTRKRLQALMDCYHLDLEAAIDFMVKNQDRFWKIRE